MSEAKTCQHIFAPYCEGRITMEVGYGGFKTVPWAWAFDLPQPYTSVGGDPQQLRGDCRRFPMLSDGGIGAIIQNHCYEDFTYEELVPMLNEVWRVLEPGGLFLNNMPYQDRFEAHCAKTGQGLNAAHQNSDFSLENFKSKVVAKSGPWEIEFEEPNHGPYSFLLILRKPLP